MGVHEDKYNEGQAKMNGKPHDASQNTQLAAELVAAPMGALDVDAPSKYVLLSNASVLKSGRNQLSVEGWIKVPQFAPRDTLEYTAYTLYGGGDGLSDRNIAFFIYHNFDPSWGPGYEGYNQPNIAGSVQSDGSANQMSWSIGGVDLRAYEGQWVHLAMTWVSTGDKKTKLYINGVEVSSYLYQSAGASTIRAQGNDAIIGAGKYNGNISAGTKPFIMDELRFWNKELSAGDIVAAKDGELVGNEADLIGYWHFNGDLNDHSPSGAVGQAVGGITIDDTEDAISAPSFDVIPLASVKHRNVTPKGAASDTQKLNTVVGVAGEGNIDIVLVSSGDVFDYANKLSIPKGNTTGSAKLMLQYTPDGGSLTAKNFVIDFATLNAATGSDVVIGTIPAGSTIKNVTFVISNDFDGSPSYTRLWAAAKE